MIIKGMADASQTPDKFDNIDLENIEISKLRHALKWRIDQIKENVDAVQNMGEMPDFYCNRKRVVEILKLVDVFMASAETLEQKCREIMD